MKKLAVLTLLNACFAFGQDTHSHIVPCANNLEQERAFQEHPEWKEAYERDQEDFQSFYEHYLEHEYDPNARSSYVIPIVFHIVHNGGVENITDAQVYDCLEKLNEDYSATNSDLGDVVPDFSGIIGNPDIEFRLATKDPSGNCHPGITRTISQNTVHDGDDDVINDVAAEHGVWPQNRYLNVFVVADPNGAAGYTNYPGNWYSPTSMSGAIYLRHDYCGTIGTGSTGRRRTISHECAHWLNIAHCWGNSNSPNEPGNCSEDDGVTDTPNSIGWTGCDLDGESCGAGVNNVQNNMEYTGSCRRMFTQGQVARMHAALNSSTAQRNNLWTPTNLANTGTDGPGDICEANFSANTQAICAGQTVTFTDLSYHNVTSRTWTFDGGTPASSTAENPTITYNTPGTYAVSIEVSDGNGTQTKTETAFISVLANPGSALPYSEGFQTVSTIPDFINWGVVDDNNQGTFELTAQAGSQGSSSSAVLNNFGNTDETADELISGTIDLSGVDPADEMVFTFDYAYRKRYASNDEWLRFYISKDCGETWILRKNIHGDDLSSVVATYDYVPQSADDWYSVTIDNINSTYYVSDFRFKFRFENESGNNIYIDNINLYPASMSSTETLDEMDELTIYPNPTTGQAKIDLNGTQSELQSVSILSADGKVLKSFSKDEIEGVSTIDLDLSSFSKGLYLVRIEGTERLQLYKLIKE